MEGVITKATKDLQTKITLTLLKSAKEQITRSNIRVAPLVVTKFSFKQTIESSSRPVHLWPSLP